VALGLLEGLPVQQLLHHLAALDPLLNQALPTKRKMKASVKDVFISRLSKFPQQESNLLPSVYQSLCW